MVLVEWAALRGKRSSLLPRKPMVWVVWGLCGLSLPVAMLIPPLARALHLQTLSWADWGLAAAVGIAATGWRALLDHFKPVSLTKWHPPETKKPLPA